MPSPLAHGSLVLVARVLVSRHAQLMDVVGPRPLFFYLAVLAALWAPDVDFLLRMLHDHPALRHGHATHSLVAGLLLGGLFTVACRLWYGARLPVLPVLGIGIGCVWAHAVMDMVTWGGGVALLWPVVEERFRLVPLFFGARHSQPAAWHLHTMTFLTELFFVVPLWWLTRRAGAAAGRQQNKV
jgi:hypothetical protein